MSNDIKDGVYRDDWLDFDDIGIRSKPEAHALTYVEDGVVHTLGAIRCQKTRGSISRDDWMCQMFGADWRTNGRVAPRRGAAVL